MISVVILYPKSDDSTFDMDYYTTKHMPMLAAAVGEACQGGECPSRAPSTTPSAG
jgi:hypothetical protein